MQHSSRRTSEFVEGRFEEHAIIHALISIGHDEPLYAKITREADFEFGCLGRSDGGLGGLGGLDCGT